MFKPSEYQAKIYDFITNGSGNAVVSAVAGSGKTTTLLNAIKLIPNDKKVLFLAFNKSIAKELSCKVPQSSNIVVKTVHGFGMSTLIAEFGNMNINNSKYRVLLREILDGSPINHYGFKSEDYPMIEMIKISAEDKSQIENFSGYQSKIGQLCDLGRMNLINTTNAEIGIAELNAIAKKHNIELVNGECSRAWALIKLGLSITKVIDFADMIYMPIAFNLNAMKFDFVFVDECQDLNSCQRDFMQKAINPNGGRFIAVGDEKQAIYGFSGADADSFSKLQSIPNTITLPLSVSYRCATSIINLAKGIVPQLEAREGAKEGIIERNSSFQDIRQGDMVLCRQTFPLVSLCLKYLSMGVKAHLMGSDIGKALIKMIADTERKTEEFNMENTFSRLYAEKNKIVSNLMRKERLTKSEAEESSMVSSYQEKIQVIELLAEGITEPQLVMAKLESIFSDDNTEGITLSTIHKSKGLEADRVFIIHSELMPSKFAKQDWEMQQENNLIYVAYTRAKSFLGFVTDFNAWDKHKSQEGNTKAVKESNYVGVIGAKSVLELEVILVKEILTSFGETTLFEMRDGDGNLFTKYGVIPSRFIVSNHSEIAEGTFVKFNATIKAHKEFKGVKSTILSTLAKC